MVMELERYLAYDSSQKFNKNTDIKIKLERLRAD